MNPFVRVPRYPRRGLSQAFPEAPSDLIQPYFGLPSYPTMPTIQDLGFRLPQTPPSISMVTPVSPAVVAAKIASGSPLTQSEIKVWKALTPVAQSLYTVLPTLESMAHRTNAATTGGQESPGATSVGTASFSDQISGFLSGETFGIPNSYLLVGGFIGVLLLAMSKRR